MTRQIRTAADELRALVGALPEPLRGVPWTDRRVEHHTALTWGKDALVATPAIIGYLARTASPDVVLALADLFDALDAHRQAVDDKLDTITIVARWVIVRAAHDHLAALITRDAS